MAATLVGEPIHRVPTVPECGAFARFASARRLMKTLQRIGRHLTPAERVMLWFSGRIMAELGAAHIAMLLEHRQTYVEDPMEISQANVT